MARPTKPGLDYFPFDTTLDRKFEILEAKHGLNGYGIIVKLLQRIYGENGYYLEFGEIDALLLGSKYGLSAEDVLTYVDTAVEQGIFDGGMYQSYTVLTSHGIQSQYVKCTERRRRVDMKQEYLLLSVPEIPVNVYINGVNVCNNPENVYTNTQSKVKESKVEKSKVKESKDAPAPEQDKSAYGRYENVFLTKDEAQDLQQRFPHDFQKKIDRLSFGIETKGYAYQNHYAVILQWAEQDAAKEQSKNLPKQSKFYNYEDTNRTDYEALEKEMMDKFLEEDDDE